MLLNLKRWSLNTFAVITLALAALLPQLSHAQAFTDFAENKVVDAVMRGQAIGTPANWFIGLDTVACTDAGGGTEVTGNAYARVSVAASLTAWAGTQSAGSTIASSGTGGVTSNNAVISFPTPTPAGWGTVVSMRIWDATTAGNAWFCITLTTSKTINPGDTVSFAAGALTLTVQ
jgi:hypothetical protein